jgi:hypothetical protein
MYTVLKPKRPEHNLPATTEPATDGEKQKLKKKK